MNEMVAQLLSVEVLKQVHTQLSYYMADQVSDLRRGHIIFLDDDILRSILVVQKVIAEKEG